MANYKEFLGLGIAGNFALHLEQAGELEDFKAVKVADENGPKGMFPFYVPNADSQLGIYPLSAEEILLPEYECNVQAEPEVALKCALEYKDGKLVKITPTHFAAYNDCSIRKEGAKKISEKKNWGEASKGLSDTLIEIDTFQEGSFMDNWRIASFLSRDGLVMRYGEDVELSGYSYMYQKLLDWILNQLNTQSDNGPLEDIASYIKEADYPDEAIISIGATRYLPYGEKTFLQEGDEVIVVLYDSLKFCTNPVLMMATSNDLDHEGLSVLKQQVKRA